MLSMPIDVVDSITMCHSVSHSDEIYHLTHWAWITFYDIKADFKPRKVTGRQQKLKRVKIHINMHTAQWVTLISHFPTPRSEIMEEGPQPITYHMSQINHHSFNMLSYQQISPIKFDT